MIRLTRHTTGVILFVAMFFLFSLIGSAQAASRSTGSSGKGSDERARKSSSSSKKKKSDTPEKGKEKADEDKQKDQLFLPEPDQSQAYTPEIFRCAECGYEQDETGVCPDHEGTQLILVLSKGKNPLEPPEVDGNEDLLVDIPLTNVTFKKAGPAASGTAALGKPSSEPSNAPAPTAPQVQPPPTTTTAPQSAP